MSMKLCALNRRLTVRTIVKDFVWHQIPIEKLGMHRIAAKFVPRLMSEDQKSRHRLPEMVGPRKC